MPGKNRPTQLIRKAARDAVYSHKGALYDPVFCSWTEDKHKELFERVYNTVRNDYWRYEGILQDMQDVYGK